MAFASSDLRTRRSAAFGAPPPNLVGGGGSPSAGWASQSSGGLDGGSSGGGGSAWGAGSSGGGSGAYSGQGNQFQNRHASPQQGPSWDRPSGGGGALADSGGGLARMSTELKATFGLILLTALCLHADQNLAAPNLSAIADDFQMTPLQKDTRLGGMVQFGFFLIGGGVALLVGPATDQVDRVFLLMAVVLIGCVPSLLMSLCVPSSKAGFFYFFLARICTGVAIGGSFPVLFSLTADIFPASQRSMVSMCISAATNIGAAIGGMMSGIVGPRYGWRVPFRLVAIPSLACAILVRLMLSDPRTVKRKQREREERAQANPAFTAWMGGEDVNPSGYVRMEELDFTKFKRILEVRTNLLIFSQSLPGCIPISVITTFLSDYLAVEHGMQVQASTLVTAAFGISCLGFAVGGSIVGQRLYTVRKDYLPLLMAACSAFAAIPFILLVNSPSGAVTTASGRPTMWALFLALLGGAGAVTGPNVRAILMNVNDSETRGTVFSAFTLTDDLGKGMGPSVVVAVTAIFGRRISYTLGFSLWWLSGAILLSMRKSLAQDAARGGGSFLPMKSK